MPNPSPPAHKEDIEVNTTLINEINDLRHDHLYNLVNQYKVFLSDNHDDSYKSEQRIIDMIKNCSYDVLILAIGTIHKSLLQLILPNEYMLITKSYMNVIYSLVDRMTPEHIIKYSNGTMSSLIRFCDCKKVVPTIKLLIKKLPHNFICKENFFIKQICFRIKEMSKNNESEIANAYTVLNLFIDEYKIDEIYQVDKDGNSSLFYILSKIPNNYRIFDNQKILNLIIIALNKIIEKSSRKQLEQLNGNNYSHLMMLIQLCPIPQFFPTIDKFMSKISKKHYSVVSKNGSSAISFLFNSLYFVDDDLINLKFVSFVQNILNEMTIESINSYHEDNLNLFYSLSFYSHKSILIPIYKSILKKISTESLLSELQTLDSFYIFAKNNRNNILWKSTLDIYFEKISLS